MASYETGVQQNTKVVQVLNAACPGHGAAATWKRAFALRTDHDDLARTPTRVLCAADPMSMKDMVVQRLDRRRG